MFRTRNRRVVAGPPAVRRPRRSWYRALLGLPLLLAALCTGYAAPAGDGWYMPHEPHFREVYDRDAANKKRQPWNDYWGWVQRFYSGGRVALIRYPGWTSQCRQFVGKVGAAETAAGLRDDLNALGRAICAEWAKDNSLRRIDSNDVRRWGEAFKRAHKAEDGSGASLRKTLETIEAEVDKKLAKARG